MLYYTSRTPWLDRPVDQEATVKACGVTVAMLQGQSWAPIRSNGLKVNVGTIRVAPYSVSSQLTGGKVRCRLMLFEWDGGVVVVRGRESRPHGEGPQQGYRRIYINGGRL